MDLQKEVILINVRTSLAIAGFDKGRKKAMNQGMLVTLEPRKGKRHSALEPPERKTALLTF